MHGKITRRRCALTIEIIKVVPLGEATRMVELRKEKKIIQKNENKNKIQLRGSTKVIDLLK